MTDVQKSDDKVNSVSPKSVIVQGSEPIDVQAIAGLLQGLVQPIAKSQEYAEAEKTRRVQIEANTTTSLLRYSFGLAVVILCIAALALVLDKDQLAEKVIFAVVGFVGGFAFGKSSQSPKN